MVRKQISDGQGLEMWWGGMTTENVRAFEDDRNVLYLDCGGGYMTICSCQNSQNCTL